MATTDRPVHRERLDELLRDGRGQLVIDGLFPDQESFAYDRVGVEACLVAVAVGTVSILVSEDLDTARDDPRTILFLDEVHMLCATANDASQLVKQDLGRGRIRCIGATTNREWRIIEHDAALARRFQGHRVPRRRSPA